MKQKIMVSHPMKDQDEEEIERRIKKAKEYAAQNGYVFVGSYFKDEYINDSSIKHPGVCYLGRSLEKNVRMRCRIFLQRLGPGKRLHDRHDVAEAYGLQLIHE